MKRTIAMLFAISCLACNINYEKTSTGLTYKIIKGKGGAKPKGGDYIKFNLEYKLSDRDSVLQSTYNSFPIYTRLDTNSMQVAYTVMEILPLMSVGDSAVISLNIDSLKNKNKIQSYTPALVKGQVLIAKIKLEQVFKDEKVMLADYDSTVARLKVSELKALEDYMAKHNLKGIKTKNGAYVVIDKPGDQTMKADSGKIATLMYKGYLPTTGVVFDTNMDTTKGHTAPLDFQVGSTSSIQGFSECLPYFGKGGKGKFLIPSNLGYGPQSPGPEIPPFSNLVFDIEVTDVKAAPAMPANPMMQQQMPGSDSSNN